MQLKLSVLGLAPEPKLKEFVTRRFRFAFDRFEHSIKRVTVQLKDLNVPGRGKDKRCFMTAELHSGDSVSVEEIRSDEHAAVCHAAVRLRHLIGNRLRILRAKERFRIQTSLRLE